MKPLDYARPASRYEEEGWTWGWIAAYAVTALAWIVVLALAAHELIFIPRTHAIVEALRALLDL
ncbi:MAG: hypothetical protein L6R28_17865 [Planctomycetes bacterium]|nr:hypothetical protein [Planctomycetota bacterium]